MYGETAAPELIELLYERGYNAIKSNKSVKAGIMAVKARELYLVEGSSNIAKEWYAYSWDVDREGNRTDKVIKKFDHAKEFYENALIRGQRRLATDRWPMDSSKDGVYPRTMIESCEHINTNKSIYTMYV